MNKHVSMERKDSRFKIQDYLSSPHKPKLEDVVFASALDGLISSVVLDIVMLVLLEQVVSAHVVAGKELILWYI